MEKEQYLKIGRPQNSCVLCGTTIAVAGKHASVLLSPGEEPPPQQTAGEEGPQRQDYCPACWEKARQKNYFSFWIARREPPKPRKLKSRKERNAALLAYFDLLLQKNDPAYAQHLYFLAHLLMKFSVLKWVRSERANEQGGRERIVFRNTATDDLVTIDSVPLEDEAVARIKKEIDDYICRNVEGGAEACG